MRWKRRGGTRLAKRRAQAAVAAAAVTVLMQIVTKSKKSMTIFMPKKLSEKATRPRNVERGRIPQSANFGPRNVPWMALRRSTTMRHRWGGIIMVVMVIMVTGARVLDPRNSAIGRLSNPTLVNTPALTSRRPIPLASPPPSQLPTLTTPRQLECYPPNSTPPTAGGTHCPTQCPGESMIRISGGRMEGGMDLSRWIRRSGGGRGRQRRKSGGKRAVRLVAKRSMTVLERRGEIHLG
mmetsp:Transcript_8479/g.18430  ORF Transcript_8479/g.18430 Transcript_8479/m.18430 type:complete len:237 (-) Transcript_8479:2987-3697(-)